MSNTDPTSAMTPPPPHVIAMHSHEVAHILPMLLIEHVPSQSCHACLSCPSTLSSYPRGGGGM